MCRVTQRCDWREKEDVGERAAVAAVETDGWRKREKKEKECVCAERERERERERELKRQRVCEKNV